MSREKEKYYSRRNLDFILYEVLDILSLAKEDYFSAHDAETMAMVLNIAEGIAEKIMRPVLTETDRNPPDLKDGKVKVHPAAADYFKAVCDSGILSACFDEKFGGQQLPRTVYAAAAFILGKAHNGFEMFTSLSNGAARLMVSFASEELVNDYVSKILSGQYTGTMCLTEPPYWNISFTSRELR